MWRVILDNMANVRYSYGVAEERTPNMDASPTTARQPVRYLTAAETATLVRGQLKAMFPGITFSVRTSGGSMTAAIRVRWTDGPTEEAVKQAVARYEGSGFDPMQDLRYPLPYTLMAWEDGRMEEVHFGADFIFVNRDLSPAFEAVLAAHATVMVAQQTNGKLSFDPDAQYMETFITPDGKNTRWPVSGRGLLRELARHIEAPQPEPKTRPRRARKAS